MVVSILRSGEREAPSEASSLPHTQSFNRTAAYLTLAVLLFSLYLITGSGGFHIIDEVSLYSVTENLARRGAWDTDQIAWSQWVNSPAEVLGTWGQDGHVYSKKGVAPALAFLPLRWLAGLLPGVGLLQTTFLANALITIATALLLWSVARRLGYREQIGASLALLFGIATLAWPYATHLFGEPLSALALTAALWALVSLRQARRVRYSFVLGLAMGVAVATSAVYALLIPLFGAVWLRSMIINRRSAVHQPNARSSPQRWSLNVGHWTFDIRHLFAIIAPLIAIAAFLLWYNWMRFGSPFDTGYHFGTGEGFNGPLLAGLYGLLLSPYRGIIYHQPITILALIGFIPFWRRHRTEALLTGGVTLILVLAFAKWWIWWAGFAWGPRFLVPLAPYLILWMAPLLAAGRRWLVWGVAGLSALVQLLAVSANYVLWEIELRSLYPTDWNDPLRYGAPATDNPLHSPVFGQIYLLARGQWDAILDFAWWQDGKVFWWIPLAGLTLAAVAAWGLWKMVFSDRQSAVNSQASGLSGSTVRRPGRSGFWISLLLAAILLPFTFFALRAYAQDPHYGAPDQGYRAILTEVEAGERPEDVLITVAPYHYHIPMNFYNGSLPILGFATQQPLRPETEGLLQWAVARGGTIDLVTAGLPPADPSNGVELWLNEHAYRADDRWFDDFRLLHYGATQPIISLPAGQTWGVPPLLTLDEARISSQQAHPGQTLSLEMQWHRLEPAPDLHLFVQLLPPAPPPVAQFDSAFSTGSWKDGQKEVTRMGLWLPPDVPPGDYALIIGWYDPATGQRLSVGGADFQTITTIHVSDED